MTRLTRPVCTRPSDEAGFAMAAVVVMIAVLSLLAVTTIDLVTSEQGRSDVSRTRGTSFAAAEAGLNDYLAKLTDDKVYYLHRVHPGESTRRPTSGADVDPQTSQCVEASAAGTRAETGVIWPTAAGTTWTYPSGKDNWCRLSTGYEYNLQIVPPSAANTNIQIVATGRKIGDTNAANWRAIEQWTHFSLVSEFQMITASDYTVGSTATTNGKVYAGIDSSGVKHNVDHDGFATANIYAEGTVSGNVLTGGRMSNGAKQYSSAHHSERPLADQEPDPLLELPDVARRHHPGGGRWRQAPRFECPRLEDPLPERRDVRRVAVHRRLYRPCGGDTADVGWRLDLHRAAERRHLQRRHRRRLGVVNGRVTVATNDDVVVGGNTSYVTPGDDVLGLIAKNDVTIAKWGPSVLDWRGAVIAQNGKRSSYDSCNCKTSATHTGSSASYQHPFMDMFVTRSTTTTRRCSTCRRRGSRPSTTPTQLAIFREVAAVGGASLNRSGPPCR